MVSSFNPLEREAMGPKGRRAAFTLPSGVDEGFIVVELSELGRNEGGTAEGEGVESEASEGSSRSPERGREGDAGGVLEPAWLVLSVAAMVSVLRASRALPFSYLTAWSPTNDLLYTF